MDLAEENFGSEFWVNGGKEVSLFKNLVYFILLISGRNDHEAQYVEIRYLAESF